MQEDACRRLGRSHSLNVRVTWSTAWPHCSDKMQRSQTERTVHPHQSHGGERCCVLTGVEDRVAGLHGHRQGEEVDKSRTGE